MATDNSKKRLTAERLYIEEGWTAKDIASTVGVAENTVGSWVKKYRWKNSRSEMIASPVHIKRLLLQEVQAVIEGNSPKFNSDALAKLTRAIERIDKSVNIQTIISSFKLFTDWLTTQDVNPETLDIVVTLTKDFIRHSIDHE